MLFGSPYAPLGVPYTPVSPIIALFDTYPIGTRLEIGENSSFWIGNFGGIQDGVALLTNAQLRSNIGTPIDGPRPIVRIPIRNITFVAL